MKKILIISNNDSVWLKPAWAKVINSDNNLFEFNLITLPEKKLKNMNPAVYYFRSFGAKNFIFLSIFSIVRNIKFYKTNKKTFSKDICMKLNFFDIDAIEGKIRDFEPDIVFITCSYIIPKKLLQINDDILWFNKHASLLPDGKGVFPYIYNTINGFQQGITFHYVSEYVDSGDIVYFENINHKKTMVDFYKEIYDSFDEYFMKFYKNLKANVKHKQSGHGSYFSYPDKKELKKFYKAGGKIISFKDIF